MFVDILRKRKIIEPMNFSSLHSLAAFLCINSLFIAAVGHQYGNRLHARNSRTVHSPTIYSADASWMPSNKLEADIYFYMQPTAYLIDHYRDR